MMEILLPLFPLEVVLLPEEPLPLHIFEERYKQMVGECLEAKASGSGQQEFGVVLAQGKAMRRVGCSARIVNLTHKYEDGRMDILTVGKRRFEVLLTNEEKVYLRAAVEFFEDEGPDTPGETEAAHAIEGFREAMRKLRAASEMPIHLTRPYRYLSFRLAAPLPLDLEFKQQLLTMRNEPERLRFVVRAIEAVLAQFETIKKARRKAGGDGDLYRPRSRN
jgi:Lon protease-like protein